MRYIDKTRATEPAAFAAWKAEAGIDWSPTWAGLDDVPDVKAALRDGLLTDQGYICAYCCQGVDATGSHIEHVEPRSKAPGRAVDYTNLVASCPGETNRRPSVTPGEQHCGHKKGEWYDADRFVSPLDPSCDDAFEFTGFGDMRPSAGAQDLDASTATIGRLNLNCTALRQQRREVIGAEIDRLQRQAEQQGPLTRADITARVATLASPNARGRRAPFAPALIHVLLARAARTL